MKRSILFVLVLVLLVGCSAATEAEAGPAEILTEPPGLTVESGGTKVEAELSTYSWSNRLEGDLWECVNADAPHPLDVLEQYPVLKTEMAEAVLVFEVEPDELSQVTFCRKEAFGDTYSPEEEGTIEDGVVQLEEGLCLYTVWAAWEREDWGGTVSYVFQAERR